MSLADYKPTQQPGNCMVVGGRVKLEVYDPSRHLSDLFSVLCGPDNEDIWTFIPFAMPPSQKAFESTFEKLKVENGFRTMVIRRLRDEKVLGAFSFMRIRHDVGSAEIGAVLFGKELQRTTEATEAFYLSAKHIFEKCSYRRYEWKCDQDNKPSTKAALRYGFIHEGCFRQDMIVKGKNRNTEWYSMLDTEWPNLVKAYKAWLSNDNFLADGAQKLSLKELRLEN